MTTVGFIGSGHIGMTIARLARTPYPRSSAASRSAKFDGQVTIRPAPSHFAAGRRDLRSGTIASLSATRHALEDAAMEAITSDLFRAVRAHTTGWENAMYVVKLRDGSLLVHSPTDLGEETFDEIRKLGDVRFLFAPNHFHNAGLAPYRRAFPDAKVIATALAAKRLRAKGHDVQDLEAAEVPLPEGASFLVCEGTKTGEAFLSWPGSSRPIWIVCDAFFNVPRLTGFSGTVMRALQSGPGLAIGKTLPWLALADRKRYAAWLDDKLVRQEPEQLLFSHGVPLPISDIGAVRSLVSARL